jgi:hypothetical protein
MLHQRLSLRTNLCTKRVSRLLEAHLEGNLDATSTVVARKQDMVGDCLSASVVNTSSNNVVSRTDRVGSPLTAIVVFGEVLLISV